MEGRHEKAHPKIDWLGLVLPRSFQTHWNKERGLQRKRVSTDFFCFLFFKRRTADRYATQEKDSLNQLRNESKAKT